ncbi:MAG: 50S ribosomal protein L20 [Candidatus Peribacteraceae bacterium]|nr:50S ribosomal protein L20 [Candidatus Peribacteraceae bacterium]
MRVKRGIHRHRRHKKIRKLAKGYQGVRSETYRKAREAVIKAGQHAFRDRRKKKRNFRSLWITRLTAAVRARGTTYAVFIKGLKTHKIELDRKVLSELAIHEVAVFDKIVEKVKVTK